MNDWPIEASPRVAIAGTGQAAWALGLGFLEAGIKVTQVWSRHAGKGNALARRLQAEHCMMSDSGDSAWEGEVLLLAIADHSIAEVSSLFKCLENQHIIHCGATISIDVLSGHLRYGVFWPVMNLSQPREDLLREVPIMVESNNEALHEILTNWCIALHAHSIPATLTQRTKVHLAAVMTANFNNLLLHWGHSILKGQGSHNLLLPILQEQLFRFAEDSSDPLTRQSGPAYRGDLETMDKHLDLLQQDPEGQALYRSMSHLIAHLRAKHGHD